MNIVVFRIFFLIGFLFFLIFFLAIGIAFFYFFVIPPQIVSVSPSNQSSDVSLNSPLVIKFNKPIGRQKINHATLPEVYGEWKFEDPLIAGHFFRTLVFTPEIELRPNEKYYIKLDNIVAPLDFGYSNWFYLSFKTKPSDANLANTAKTAVPDTGNTSETISKIIGMIFHNSTNVKDTNVSNNGNTNEAISKIIKKPSVNSQSADFNNPVNKNTSEVISKLIETPSGWQDHPLSCEAASLKMALAAKGVNVSEDDIMQKIGYDTTAHEGDIWGNPYNAFVGSISGSMCTTGYGVYWEPVAKAASYWRPAESFSGWDIKQVINEIKLGNPVIFWGVLPTGKLTNCSWYTPQGKYIKAFKEDHVRVVVGFIGSSDNPTKIIIKDPLNGDLYWPTSEFLTNWKIYDNSGVVIR